MTREPGHTPDLGHGTDSAPADTAGTAPRALATADPALAADVGASGPRNGGSDVSSRSAREETLVGAPGSSVLLVNTGLLTGYDGNAGKRAGMPCPYLVGSSGGDVLVGGDGSDLVLGREGGDFLIGGVSDDRGAGQALAADFDLVVGVSRSDEVLDLHSRALLAALDDWSWGQSAWGRRPESEARDALAPELGIARRQGGDAATSATTEVAADEGGARNGDAPPGDGGDAFDDGTGSAGDTASP
jgi:hypothetical protein